MLPWSRVHADDGHGAPPGAVDTEAGFVSLYNGTDLTGWQGNLKSHLPQPDGSLMYDHRKGEGNLYTEKEYANFVLRFDFKLTPGANNGLGIRTPREGVVSRQGIEIQMLDDSAPRYKDFLPSHRHGSVYDAVAAKPGHLKPTGEWNSQEVRAEGPRIRVTLNGVTIVDANLDDITDERVLNEHPGLRNTTGHVALLSHWTTVWFRNLRIKELP